MVSKLANDERRRRGVYSSEYAGKLPFTVDGLDDQSIPTIEFEIRQIGAGGAIVPKSKDTSKTPKITAAELPSLTRADLDGKKINWIKIHINADLNLHFLP